MFIKPIELRYTAHNLLKVAIRLKNSQILGLVSIIISI